MIFGILPNVRITRNHRGAHSSECVRSCTTRLEGSLTKMPRKNGDHSAEALSKNSHQLGCLFQDTEPPGSSSILRKATQVLKSTRKVKFAENTRRHIKIREKGSTLGVIQPTKPHERCPYAPKVEDWSREETEMQERCARGDVWRLARRILKLKKRIKLPFSHLLRLGVSQRHPLHIQRERICGRF